MGDNEEQFGELLRVALELWGAGRGGCNGGVKGGEGGVGGGLGYGGS